MNQLKKQHVFALVLSCLFFVCLTIGQGSSTEKTFYTTEINTSYESLSISDDNQANRLKQLHIETAQKLFKDENTPRSITVLAYERIVSSNINGIIESTFYDVISRFYRYLLLAKALSLIP